MKLFTKILPLVFLLLCTFAKAGNKVENGFIDLRNLDFKSNVSQSLVGEWKLYFNKTLNQLSSFDDTGFVLTKVPGNWTNNEFPSHGYATYTVRVLVNSEISSDIYLKILPQSTNYNLYLNGDLISTVGHFSKSADDNVPDYVPQILCMGIDSDTLNLAFEVSNFNYKKGGLWFDIDIGSRTGLDGIRTRSIVFDALLIGALLIVFFYFIGIYALRPSEKVVLYFGLMCLAAAFRISATGETLIRQLDIPISWEWLIKIEFISLFMIPGFGGVFLAMFYPLDFNKKIVRFVYYSNVILSIAAIVLPAKYSSYIIPPYLFYIFFQAVYFLHCLSNAFRNKRPNRFAMIGGFLVIFMCGLNDIFYSQEMINSIFLLPFGVFILLFSQSYAISSRLSKAFDKVEELGAKLSESNRKLEEKVTKRTEEIIHQKEELEQLNIVKDKIFSIVSHDLRGPVNSFGTLLNWFEDEEISQAEFKKLLSGVRRNFNNLNLTLENLLVWSRSQLSGIETLPEVVDIRSNINSKIELYQPLATNKRIKLRSEVSERTLAFVDKNHLELLLRNLVTNAIKFSNEGGEVVITATTSKGFVEVAVRDNGVGIPEDKIGQLFRKDNPFSTYGTANEKGTGLGLMLCKEFVEKNGGEINVDSEQGKGTTVRFTIKAA